MPILTKQIRAIREIKQKEITPQEKIVLLKQIELDPQKSDCFSCQAKRRAAKRLLDQMIDYEIKQQVAYLSSNDKDNRTASAGG